ncbi:MAG: hypothetical protein ABI343_21215 [Burkholderiaceae bacterium]
MRAAVTRALKIFALFLALAAMLAVAAHLILNLPSFGGDFDGA